MADVLLTHSYFLRFDAKEFRAMMPYAPLGTLYAAAFLRSKGFHPILFDAMLEEREDGIVPLIEKARPRIVVIYDDDFNYLTKMCLKRMRDAAFRMIGLAKSRGCTVVVHGSDPSDQARDYLDHGADYVVRGEGEITLAELVSHLLGSTAIPPDAIRGLVYNNAGAIIRNQKREVLHDLDRLPFPARDLVDIEHYRRLWKKHHGHFSMNIVTTRGCPFHCNWCAKPIYGQVYNSRSPENVVEEMLQISHDFHPDHLWFCDDIFGLKPGWVPQFADAVRKREAVIPFKCLSRVDLLLKEDTIQYLADAGCKEVWVGAESGSQRVLDAMEKGTTVKQIYEASSILRRHGIRVGFFLQYGYPGESKRDIELTLQMVKDCKPDEIGVSVSYPLPGTKFYEKVKEQLGGKKNWFDSQDLDLMFAGEYEPDFYRALHRITHKRFRIWQGMDILKQTVAHPASINRHKMRRIAATMYHALTLPTLEAKLNTLEHRSTRTKESNA